MTFIALPLHQLTTRRGPNHRMYAYEDFCGGKVHIPVSKVTSLYKPYRHVLPQRQCAKKVVSDSPGLVDFAIGLVKARLPILIYSKH